MHKYKNIRDESELLKKQLSRIFVAVPAVEWDEALEAAVFFGSSLLIMHIKTSQGKKDTRNLNTKKIETKIRIAILDSWRKRRFFFQRYLHKHRQLCGQKRNRK